MAPSLPGLDLLATAVVLLDGERRVVGLNPAAENLFAVSSRHVLGQPLTRLIGEHAGLAAELDRAARENWSYTGQNLVLERDGGRRLHLDCTVSPADAPPVRLVMEFRPIEQQMRATREERLLEQQLANRELIRNLAHEIKNPLGGIRGSAQLLERELADPRFREYTQVIIQEADRLQDLMNRLLSPHRTPLPGPVNIHEILERVRRLVLSEFPQLRLRRDYDTSLPELVADREQLIQALLNIVRNAAQAMDGQGEVLLRTRAARQVTLAKRRYRLALEVQVVDNGPGIADELRERIFYPLVSGRDGGSGLGLTLAQNFVQQHHGSIEVASLPGHTCFTVLLPLGEGRAEPVTHPFEIHRQCQ